MGHVAEGGVTTDMTETTVEIPAATSAVPLVKKTVSVAQSISWPGLNLSLENIAAGAGIPESKIVGTGVAGDPYTLALIPDDFQTLKNISLYFEGVREDGWNVEIRGWNGKWILDKSTTFARNAAAELPIGADVKAIQYLLWT